MDTATGEIRAFIALELPDELKRFLAELSGDLRHAGGDVKWLRPESIHLTLKFLGAVRTELVPELGKVLVPVFSRQQTFRIMAKGLGAFPHLGRPRVVWVGLEDKLSRLEGLAAHVETVVEPLGFPREKRPFSPHLTLGRVRSDRGKRDLVESIRQRMEIAGPAFTVDHAVLFQSILKPSGAEYRALGRFGFSP